MVGICTWITICLATTLTVSVYSHHSFQSCPVLSSLREFDTHLPSAPATGRTTSRIPTTSSTTTTSIILQPFHSIIDEEEEEFFGRKSSFPPGGRSGFSRRPNFCLSNLGFEVPTASDLRSFNRSRFSPSRGLGCVHGRVFRGSFINVVPPTREMTRSSDTTPEAGTSTVGREVTSKSVECTRSVCYTIASCTANQCNPDKEGGAVVGEGIKVRSKEDGELENKLLEEIRKQHNEEMKKVLEEVKKTIDRSGSGSSVRERGRSPVTREGAGLSGSGEVTLGGSSSSTVPSKTHPKSTPLTPATITPAESKLTTVPEVDEVEERFLAIQAKLDADRARESKLFQEELRRLDDKREHERAAAEVKTRRVEEQALNDKLAHREELAALKRVLEEQGIADKKAIIEQVTDTTASAEQRQTVEMTRQLDIQVAQAEEQKQTVRELQDARQQLASLSAEQATLKAGLENAGVQGSADDMFSKKVGTLDWQSWDYVRIIGEKEMTMAQKSVLHGHIAMPKMNEYANVYRWKQAVLEKGKKLIRVGYEKEDLFDELVAQAFQADGVLLGIADGVRLAEGKNPVSLMQLVDHQVSITDGALHQIVESNLPGIQRPTHIPLTTSLGAFENIRIQLKDLIQVTYSPEAWSAKIYPFLGLDKETEQDVRVIMSKVRQPTTRDFQNALVSLGIDQKALDYYVEGTKLVSDRDAARKEGIRKFESLQRACALNVDIKDPEEEKGGGKGGKNKIFLTKEKGNEEGSPLREREGEPVLSPNTDLSQGKGGGSGEGNKDLSQNRHQTPIDHSSPHSLSGNVTNPLSEWQYERRNRYESNLMNPYSQSGSVMNSLASVYKPANMQGGQMGDFQGYSNMNMNYPAAMNNPAAYNYYPTPSGTNVQTGIGGGFGWYPGKGPTNQGGPGANQWGNGTGNYNGKGEGLGGAQPHDSCLYTQNYQSDQSSKQKGGKPIELGEPLCLYDGGIEMRKVMLEHGRQEGTPFRKDDKMEVPGGRMRSICRWGPTCKMVMHCGLCKFYHPEAEYKKLLWFFQQNEPEKFANFSLERDRRRQYWKERRASEKVMLTMEKSDFQSYVGDEGWDAIECIWEDGGTTCLSGGDF